MDWKGIWDKGGKGIKVQKFVAQVKRFLIVIVSGYCTTIEQYDDYERNIYMPMKLL